MIAVRVPPLILITLVAAQAVACASAPARFHSLDSTATPNGAAATRAAVIVGPVSVPASVDQPQFVVQVAPNRVEVEEFNRWDAPLNDSIARAIAGDRAVQLGRPEVTTDRLATFIPPYSVTVDVQRFESIRGQGAFVEAVWTVRKTAGGETRSGRTAAREAVKDEGFDSLAAAHSRALASVSGDIAGAIREKLRSNRSGSSRFRQMIAKSR
ncbi:MAG: membrane integrity-associated transporter subunit PqiC [Candidatus Binataceae bacterium]